MSRFPRVFTSSCAEAGSLSANLYRFTLSCLCLFVILLLAGGAFAQSSSPSAESFSEAQSLTQPLFDEVGHLQGRVSLEEQTFWKRELHQAKTSAKRITLLHLRLGEWELAGNENPKSALHHFRQAQKTALLGKKDPLYGLAAYDIAVTEFRHGAYYAAEKDFKTLLHSHLIGYDHQRAALWARHASACAGYHDERSKMGIPEPQELDPKCAAAGLAVCLRGLRLSYDEKTILAACRVTGLGSNVQDIVNACTKLNVASHVLSADDTGLKALPMPLIAHVERDHFIAVTKADAKGVTYVCSDCGPWPGGENRLAWKQWHALSPDAYVAVVKKGSSEDRVLGAVLSRKSKSPVAIAVPHSVGTKASALFKDGHKQVFSSPPYLTTSLLNSHVYAVVNWSDLFCGFLQNALHCLESNCCPLDELISLFGASEGDPVNLATLEEEYHPGADLVVYNPHGPTVVWKRIYNSLRGADQSYQRSDFGMGWSHPYNISVQDKGALAPDYFTAVQSRNSVRVYAGTKYLVLPNGARVSFTNNSVPNAQQPVIHCMVQSGYAFAVDMCYDPNDPAGYYIITLRDGSKWQTGNWSYVYPLTDIENPDIGLSYQLKKVTDRLGNSLNFVYDSGSSSYSDQPSLPSKYPLLASIQDASSGTALIVFHRDSTGHVSSVDDAYGRSIYYKTTSFSSASNYNSGGIQLSQVSQIVTTGTVNPPMRYQYGYQAVNNLEGEGPFEILKTITVPSPTGAGTSTATINYAPNTDYVTSIVDANGNSHSYTIVDSSHTKVTIKDPQANVVYSYTVGFDSNMNETSRTNGAGTTVLTKLFGDPNTPYRPSSVSDGMNRTTSYTWDSYNHLKTETSPRNVTTTYTWDYSKFALGRLVQIQQGSKAPTTATYYEPSGLLQSVTAPAPNGNGTVTYSETFDALGNVLTVTAPGNNATTNLVTTYGYTTDSSYSYTQAESLGEPITITNNAGKTTHLRYDQQGNVAYAFDALGNRTDVTRNIANQVTSVLYPGTGQTGNQRGYSSASFLYPGGPLTSATLFDEGGNSIRSIALGYGAEGELLTRTGSTEPITVTYDALYRKVQVADGNNNPTKWHYNTAGYLDSMTYPDGKQVLVGSYDNSGRPLQATDARGVVTNYTYNDPAGALTDIQYPASPALNIHNVPDSYGRLASRTDAVGSTTYTYSDRNFLLNKSRTYTGLPALTLGYNYYPNGSRSTLTTPGGNFSYNYDTAGRLANLLNPFGEQSNWTYLDNNWFSTQAEANGITSTYTLNALGQLTDLKNAPTAGGTALSEFSSLVHNGAGELTTATTSASLGGLSYYGYDNKGQLTSESSSGLGVSNTFAYDAAGNSTTFANQTDTFNADNQIAGPTFDAQGNPTQYSSQTGVFDARSQLTAYGSQLTAGYTAEGLRAWKQNSAGQRTWFLYDGGSPVVEVNASGTVSAVNTWGARGLISRNTTGSGSVFYLFDHLGNVAQRLNSSGQVLSTHRYTAYGSTPDANPDPFGYKGQYGYYGDRETGLILCGFRYYDPAAGRWLNRDPIGMAGGVNVYAYCGNNPIGGVDPSGLQETAPEPEGGREGGSGNEDDLPEDEIAFCENMRSFGEGVRGLARGIGDLFRGITRGLHPENRIFLGKGEGLERFRASGNGTSYDTGGVTGDGFGRSATDFYNAVNNEYNSVDFDLTAPPGYSPTTTHPETGSTSLIDANAAADLGVSGRTDGNITNWELNQLRGHPEIPVTYWGMGPNGDYVPLPNPFSPTSLIPH